MAVTVGPVEKLEKGKLMSETHNGDESKLEVMPPSALLSIERASVDGQIATAHQYPRSLEQFKKRALGMATLDAEVADSCIYVRPVGKEKNEKGQWVERYAEGPSIRLAEIVAVSYGNIRAFSRIVEQTERFVRCEGFAHDLESNAAMKSECVESTVNREGQPYSERQRTLTAKVCLKKALRDAIFTVVPRALCKPIIDAAKRVGAGQDKSLEERRKKAQAWVTSLKIDEARVFGALGIAGWTEVTHEHLITLTGLKTAMADGDETIESAFPPVEDKGKADPTGLQQSKGETSKTETKKKEKAGDKAPVEGSKTPQDTPKADPATSTPPAEQTTQAPQPAAEPAQPEQTPEPDQAFAAKQGDSDGLASVKLVASKAGITLNQLMAYLQKKKLSREGQKLSELAEGKLANIANHMNIWLPDIRALPR